MSNQIVFHFYRTWYVHKMLSKDIGKSNIYTNKTTLELIRRINIHAYVYQKVDFGSEQHTVYLFKILETVPKIPIKNF